jgi:hypothetical protein
VCAGKYSLVGTDKDLWKLKITTLNSRKIASIVAKSCKKKALDAH